MSTATTPAIALISMPWAIFNRPSIQLGALKAYAESAADVQVQTLHPYLQMAQALGTDTYNTLAENGWAGEALFAALLFPEMREKAEKLFREGVGSKHPVSADFADLLERTETCCAEWRKSLKIEKFSLIGFSLCFNQLLPSLYMAGMLKKKKHCPPILFGGSSCGGELGRSLLDNFSEIDYILDGEGELTFQQLCRHLAGHDEFPQELLTREQDGVAPTREITDLDSLPIPDYSNYFSQAQQVFKGQPFIPVLPIEFSRGCWWNKCTFCNLNLQWKKYRWKNSERVHREIQQLAARHQTLDFTFTDNALPPKEAIRLFTSLAETPEDYRFFAEVRAITRAETLQLYRRAGLTTIQVGIEAVSDTLLGRMDKGVSAIENVAIMRHSLEHDIQLEGNLIIEFPGSTEDEVAETLTTLDSLLPFNPLSSAAFFLGLGSPVHQCPKKYGITRIVQHRKNTNLFPGQLLANLTLLSKDYHGDRLHQRKIWQPVKKKLAQWQKFHRSRKNRTRPALSYRDGGTFMVIRQEQAEGNPTLHHRLQGQSRNIYIYCTEIRSLDEICRQFEKLSESAIQTFIDQLCTKRLMFQQQGRVLSLAVHYP